MALLIAFLAAATASFSATESISSADIKSHVATARQARMSCGPTCVWFCLRTLGRKVDTNTVLQRAEVGERGIRMDDLVRLARSFGLPAKAIALDTKRLDALPTPSILVIGETHCIVLEWVDSGLEHVSVFEPATGRRSLEPMRFLEGLWTGEAIVFGDPPLSLIGFLSLTSWTTLIVLSGISGACLAVRRWKQRKNATRVVAAPDPATAESQNTSFTALATCRV